MKNCSGWRLLTGALLASLFVTSNPLFAKQVIQADSETSKPKGKNKADLESLLNQLNADSYDERQKASQKLVAAGIDAIPTLKRAANSETHETSTRAIDILKDHFENGDQTLKSAAKQVLEEIARSENALSAGKAKGILERPAAKLPKKAQSFKQVVQKRISISRKIVNGVKEIEVDENGKKVKIVDDPGRGIIIKLVGQKDGKEVIENFEARNAKELKQKAPGAHKLFEKYSGNNVRIQIGPGGTSQIGSGDANDLLKILRNRLEKRKFDR